jgi:hypothetical protein
MAISRLYDDCELCCFARIALSRAVQVVVSKPWCHPHHPRRRSAPIAIWALCTSTERGSHGKAADNTDDYMCSYMERMPLLIMMQAVLTCSVTPFTSWSQHAHATLWSAPSHISPLATQ